MVKWFLDYHFAQKPCFITDMMAICDGILAYKWLFDE